MNGENEEKRLLMENGSFRAGEESNGLIYCAKNTQSTILIKRINNRIFHSKDFSDRVATKRLLPYMFIYYLIIIAISCTDISLNKNVVAYCNLVKSIVPSFEDNLMIANNSHKVCFVLSVSWTFVALIIMITIFVLLKSYIIDMVFHIGVKKMCFNLNRITVVNIIFFSFFLLLITCRFYIPNDIDAYGSSGKLLVLMLKSGVFTSSVYGLMDIFISMIMCIGLIKFFSEIVDVFE